MDGRDNMELGMEDIDDNIEDIVDLSHKVLPTLFPRLVLGLIWSRLLRKGCVPTNLRWMCISLKFLIRILHHIRLNRLPWSSWSYITLLHWQLTCSIVLLVNFLQPW